MSKHIEQAIVTKAAQDLAAFLAQVEESLKTQEQETGGGDKQG